MLELLDDSPVTPGETRPAYDGYEASKQIIIDAESALNEWTLDSAQVKPTLSFKQDYEEYEEDEEEGEQQEGEAWAEEEHQEGVEESQAAWEKKMYIHLFFQPKKMTIEN